MLRSVYCIKSIAQLVNLLPEALSKFNYDLIVIGDDETLLDIANSSLSLDLKQQVLPISSLDGLRHLYSKIGLSKILKKFGIKTPNYQIANSEAEVIALSDGAHYPLLLKIDSSGGGGGVFLCNSKKDLFSHLKSYVYPLLLQDFIDGDLLDLSAFYQNGQLIYFTYSKFERTTGGKFGPSSVRSYKQLATVPKEIFEELQGLGTALNAHGFVNISAIHSKEDNKNYYFEADMRPNVWVDYGKHIGNDAAIALKNYFYEGTPLKYPQTLNPDFPNSILIPYILRLSFFELIMNKHNCSDFIFDYSHIALIIFTKINHGLAKLSHILIKPIIPSRAWSALKHLHRQIAGRIFTTL